MAESNKMNWQVLLGMRFIFVFFITCAQLREFIENIDSDFVYNLRKFTAIGNVIALLLLSGYATANSIKNNPEGFYKRRFLRIYPLYFCAIVLSLLPFLIFGNKIETLHAKPIVPPNLVSIVEHLTLLQGLAFGTFTSNLPLWPLGILAPCYLLTPLLHRLSDPIIVFSIAISGSLYVAVPFFYKLFYHKSLPYYPELGYELPFFLFAWAWLLGFLYFRKQNKKAGTIVLCSGFIMLILNQSRTGFYALILYLMACLGLIFVIFARQIKLPKAVGNTFEYLGNIAYPFYLLHKPTFIFAYKLLGVTNSVTHMFLALLVAIFFYHAVDLPLRSRNTLLATQGE
jgi:peptidoglycan/LPS O-acetylase OafA/YrhL